MDSILNKVKDAVAEKARGRGNDNDNYNDTPMSADRRGYSHEEALDAGGYGGEERGTASGGYGGYGGQPASSRPEDDGWRGSSARELRPAQGSGAFGMAPGGGDYSGAREVAEQHAGGDGSLFTTALGFLSGREKDLAHGDVDEGEFVRHHRDIYGGEQDGGGGGGGGRKDSQGLGQAAAMQALKKFTSGGGGGGGGGGASGQDQNAFIGLAMAEAAKLFDSQSSKGAVASGETKQDVVSQAAQYAMKLFLKSKFDAAGGGESGAASGLMGMASKYLM